MADAPAARAGKNLPKRIVKAYQEHVDYRREAALRMWLAFIVTFLLLRGLTLGIRNHLLPVGNVVTSSGLHIHHFVWGILILIVVGFLGITLQLPKLLPWVAVGFGVGAALVLDEFALWLNLRDVYWEKQGGDSVHLVILVAALLGVYYAADRFWKQVVMEVRAVLRLAISGEQRLFRRRKKSA